MRNNLLKTLLSNPIWKSKQKRENRLIVFCNFISIKSDSKQPKLYWAKAIGTIVYNIVSIIFWIGKLCGSVLNEYGSDKIGGPLAKSFHPNTHNIFSSRSQCLPQPLSSEVEK